MRLLRRSNISSGFLTGKRKVAGILMVDLVSSFLEPMRLFHAFPGPFAPEFFSTFNLQNRSKITWFKNQGIYLFQSRYSQTPNIESTVYLLYFLSGTSRSPSLNFVNIKNWKKRRTKRKVQHDLNKNTFLFILGFAKYVSILTLKMEEMFQFDLHIFSDGANIIHHLSKKKSILWGPGRELQQPYFVAHLTYPLHLGFMGT